MPVTTQFSIFLVNKPGVLAAVTSALAQAKINIMALALADSGEHGVLRIVCNDAQATRKVLNEAHDRWTEAEVITAELDDKPGAFARIAQALADNNVNISYAYCTSSMAGSRTMAVFKVVDLKKAEAVLAECEKKR